MNNRQKHSGAAEHTSPRPERQRPDEISKRPDIPPLPARFDLTRERPNVHIDTKMLRERPDLPFVEGLAEVAGVDYGGKAKGRLSPFLVTDPREEPDVRS